MSLKPVILLVGFVVVEKNAQERGQYYESLGICEQCAQYYVSVRIFQEWGSMLYIPEHLSGVGPVLCASEHLAATLRVLQNPICHSSCGVDPLPNTFTNYKYCAKFQYISKSLLWFPCKLQSD